MAMRINTDLEDLSDAGYDKFLNSEKGYTKTGSTDDQDTYRKASTQVGGTYGDEANISLGNGLVKIDGENRRIIINDGATDRILIGFQQGGF